MAEVSEGGLADLIRRGPTGALRARRPGAYRLPEEETEFSPWGFGRYLSPHFRDAAPRRPLSEGFARVVRDGVEILAWRFGLKSWAVVALLSHELRASKRELRSWARVGVAAPAERDRFIGLVDLLDSRGILVERKRERRLRRV